MQSGGCANFMLMKSEEPSLVNLVRIPQELGAPKGAWLGGSASIPIEEEYDGMT